MNVYLDIDGVLLANDLNAANYVHQFLEKVNENAETVYWLTTHCQGNAETAYKRLSLVFEAETLELIKNYQPTTWDTAKTRAIDFTKPFLWFDDDLFYEERQVLLQNNALDNWINVDLAKNPNQLRDFVVSFPLPVQGIIT